MAETTQEQSADLGAQLQEAFATAQELEQRLTVTSRQLEVVEELLTEKRQARDTVEAWREAAEGDEILIPVGGSTFIPAKVARTDLVIKGVGAGYALEHAPEKALAALKEEIEALEKDVNTLTASATQLETQLRQVNAYLQRMQGGQEG